MTRVDLQIEQFLEGNSHGSVWVIVGFSSAAGLRWLHDRTEGRPVRLLIGDTRKGFSYANLEDRRRALDFLERSDVEVLNWHRRDGSRTIHDKQWLIVDQRPLRAVAALVGSANLTRNGLFENHETMTLASASDLGRLYDEANSLMSKARSIKGSLHEQISQMNTSKTQDTPRTGPSSKTSPAPPPPEPQKVNRRKGKWGIAAGIAVVVAVGAGSIFVSQKGTPSQMWSSSEPPTTLSPEVSTDDLQSEENITAVAEGSPPGMMPSTGNIITDGEATSEVLAGSSAEAIEAPVPTETGLPAPIGEACPYLLPSGDEACDVLASLGGLDTTPCASIPIEYRPLRLDGENNPAFYQPSEHAPDLVCAWSVPETLAVGQDIPSGYLRSSDSTLSPGGTCSFVLSGKDGAELLSNGSYSERWSTGALLHVRVGETLTTSGCGWVPADTFMESSHEPLGPGNAAYPLLVGIDKAIGAIRVECPFYLWPKGPNGMEAWGDALVWEKALLMPAGPYEFTSGQIVWVDCSQPADSVEADETSLQELARVLVRPVSITEQQFGFEQTFELVAVNSANSPVNLPIEAVLPSYELHLAYYVGGGTVGFKCRYHHAEASVRSCDPRGSSFVPSTLTLGADGITTFRIVCHDPNPNLTGDVQTYQWVLTADEGSPLVWPPSGQFTCRD